jgi:cytoskeletal protein CcmA (bactofilin family)
VQADITAKEVVVMGKVTGNIECSDRTDIRSEGVVHGNVFTERISVEDGAVMKGGIQVRSGQAKDKSMSVEKKPVEAATHSPVLVTANA